MTDQLPTPNYHYKYLRETYEESINHFLESMSSNDWDWMSMIGTWTNLCASVERRTMAARKEFE